ncbi:hypothetical protein [Actinoplanes cyaneus]|uniref:hypothetical protein n=1 Tax=Actinoplanes cyaneus TaxID=52696 RepID=UPI0019425614|nr:hypothetical protein [Actinoplanes cyaneus]
MLAEEPVSMTTRIGQLRCQQRGKAGILTAATSKSSTCPDCDPQPSQASQGADDGRDLVTGIQQRTKLDHRL